MRPASHQPTIPLCVRPPYYRESGAFRSARYRRVVLQGDSVTGTRAVPRTLDAGLSQLVQVRVSQVNGCGFFLNLHAGMARKAGVSEGKLDTLAGWRESPEFSRSERAALGLGEAMTRVGDGRRVEEGAWVAAREEFNDEELAALLYLVGLINVWNRINVAVELSSNRQRPGAALTGSASTSD